MTSKKLYEAFSNISDRHIKEAYMAKAKSEKPFWARWGTIAACLALVAAVGVCIFQSGRFGTKIDSVTLDNGETITFVENDIPTSNLDLDVTTKALNNEEIKMLFADLPVTANAYFDTNNRNIIGFEGKLGDVKLVVSTQGVNLLDTIIEGNQYTSTVGDVNINAGYFVTKANSQGIRTIIYYAIFDIGENTVYAEYSGTQNERESIKEELVNTIQQLIENGNFDLSKIAE